MIDESDKARLHSGQSLRVRRGDPGAASSSTAMPAFILEENPTAAAEFNDKFSAIVDGPEGFVSTFFRLFQGLYCNRLDHKWIVLPAMGDKKEDVAIVAEIASRVAQSCRLADNKGTMSLHSTQTLW